MSKYKSLDEPITRREACLILDRKRFDAAVRQGWIQPVGKRAADGTVETDSAPVTAPLLFNQEQVRDFAVTTADVLTEDAKTLRADAKIIAKLDPPMTRRQIAKVLGKKETGILIRSGQLEPYGKLTDTQTAAHSYHPTAVAMLVKELADEHAANGKEVRRMSKVRVPA